MANKEFLDKEGLKYLVSKIIAKFPKKTSDLENDSNFITEDNLVQSNWDEMSSDNPSYVQNRTHYVEKNAPMQERIGLGGIELRGAYDFAGKTIYRYGFRQPQKLEKKLKEYKDSVMHLDLNNTIYDITLFRDSATEEDYSSDTYAYFLSGYLTEGNTEECVYLYNEDPNSSELAGELNSAYIEIHLTHYQGGSEPQ